MPGNARVGVDICIGSCPCHPPSPPIPYTATWISGSTTVNTNGSGTVNAAGMAIASCGHMVSVIGFSGTVKAQSQGIHRLGDSGQGCNNVATTISGSGDTNSGG